MKHVPTVHLVDDDIAVRESLRMVLETYDLAVKEYISAKAFIASLPTDGCLLTDIEMPEMNGFELLEELRRRQSPIAAIAVTAHAGVRLWERVEGAGALALFTKPVDIDALVLTIERCVSPSLQNYRTSFIQKDSNKAPTVLIAEDQLMVADHLSDTLVDSGYHVCGIARTVEEGVTLGKKHKPDLAVLDVRLAKGGMGADIAPYLHNGKKCGVLYVTGDHSKSAALTAADGTGSIAKPYHSDGILRALDIVHEIIDTGATTLPFPSGFRLLPEVAAAAARL